MPKASDSYFALSAADSGAVLLIKTMAGCCLCAMDNFAILQKKIKKDEKLSATFQILLMATGGALGVWAAIESTPEVYDAVVEWVSENSDAVDWTVKAFAGVTNAFTVAVAPIAGMNIGGFAARAGQWGGEKLWARFFQSEASLPIVNPVKDFTNDYGTSGERPKLST